MKKLIVVVLLCLSLNVHRVNASGIPTVDILAFIQELLGYATQLEEYSEMLNQTGLSLDQYTQIVEQYEQTLVEYEHMLNQMKGLKDSLSESDYLALLNLLEIEMTTNPQGVDFDDSVFGNSDFKNVDETVGTVYTRSRDLAAMSGDIVGSGATGDSKTILDSRTNRLYRQSRMITSQMYDVDQYTQRLNDMKAAAAQAEFYRQDLATDDESDLATLQFIAWQNSLLINNMQMQQELTAAQLAYSNQLDAEVFARQAAAVDEQAARLKAAKERGEYVPVDRGYTVGF